MASALEKVQGDVAFALSILLYATSTNALVHQTGHGGSAPLCSVQYSISG